MDIEQSLNALREEVRRHLADIGERAVQEAVKNGDYHDRTGTLRRSNTYTATPDELVIENNAPYASYVQAKGYNVLDTAMLQVRQETSK